MSYCLSVHGRGDFEWCWMFYDSLLLCQSFLVPLWDPDSRSTSAAAGSESGRVAHSQDTLNIWGASFHKCHIATSGKCYLEFITKVQWYKKRTGVLILGSVSYCGFILFMLDQCGMVAQSHQVLTPIKLSEGLFVFSLFPINSHYIQVQREICRHY